MIVYYPLYHFVNDKRAQVIIQIIILKLEMRNPDLLLTDPKYQDFTTKAGTDSCKIIARGKERDPTLFYNKGMYTNREHIC